MLSNVIFLLASLGVSHARDFSQYFDSPQHGPLSSAIRPRNVAIIGAGAAGSTAAYVINRKATWWQIPVNITVYERSSHVGGRSTTVNVFDDPRYPVELGASIFVDKNRILTAAVDYFNLSVTPFRDESTVRSGAPDLGIWNGKDFVYTQSGSLNWWDKAKLLWRYGFAPVRARRLMESTVEKFMKAYDRPHFPFRSLSEVVDDVGLVPATAATGEQFLKENNIGDLFANEIVQAATRVNYAQNLPLIHGLESMVCLATDGAMSVTGGNWQIFDQLLKHSTAHVRLNKTVTEVERRIYEDTFVVQSKPSSTDGVSSSSVDGEIFDAVVLAGPYQFSGITFKPELLKEPESIPYVQLHVTLFTSPSYLAPEAFNMPPGSDVPQVILTTLQPHENLGSDPKGVGSAGFFSISTLRTVVHHESGQRQFVYKIFSPEPVNSTFLYAILGYPDPGPDAELDPNKISWIHRKMWNSYPYEYPRVTFGELMLERNLWYTSPIESFISTMETSALVGMNVAELLVDDFWLPSSREGSKLRDPAMRDSQQKPMKAEL